ncbi:MAG: hypothetical protein NTZ75_08415 [Euryarchaeota archaeon]|nr:hypothetical protein [Euryarchaeota archaeon]
MVIKEMKKFIVTTCGVIIIGLLMISSATAVPKVNSDPLMDKINEIEKNKKIIEENISNKTLDLKTRGSINLLIKIIKETIYDITLDLKAGLIIQIIQWLISLIQKLINLITGIFNLVELIYNLINLIVNLYELIIKLINFIIDIFTPKILESI